MMQCDEFIMSDALRLCFPQSSATHCMQSISEAMIWPSSVTIRVLTHFFKPSAREDSDQKRWNVPLGANAFGWKEWPAEVAKSERRDNKCLHKIVSDSAVQNEP